MMELTFTPFKDRTAQTNLGIIFSEVHQMFGRYAGRVTLDHGAITKIDRSGACSGDFSR